MFKLLLAFSRNSTVLPNAVIFMIRHGELEQPEGRRPEQACVTRLKFAASSDVESHYRSSGIL
jgi:hypothetical protein